MASSKWSHEETQACIEAYEQMLKLQKAGKLGPGKSKTSKASFRKAFSAKFGRSGGSFEMKCMNVSAVRIGFGLEIVEGYKPYGNAAKEIKDHYAEEQAYDEAYDEGRRSEPSDVNPYASDEPTRQAAWTFGFNDANRAA